MEIDTQYAVRTFFPSASFTQVFFEAVANAFDAGATNVSIIIETDGAISSGRLEVTITDDGAGFTDERFENFRRLQAPKDAYHKGLGRLVYLQYFSDISVASVFGSQRRSFVFSDKYNGGCSTEPAQPDDNPGTVLRFSSFRRERLQCYNNLKPGALKLALLDEFLPLFHRRKVNEEPFRIHIVLKTESVNYQRDFFSGDVELTAADVPVFENSELTDVELGAFTSIQTSYIVHQDRGEGDVTTFVSIDGRALPIRLIQNRPLPVGKSATFLFESDIFAGRSDSSRQRLVLPEDMSQERLFGIMKAHVGKLLGAKVPEIEKRNEETRKLFEERYPHLVGLFDPNAVGVIDKEEALRTAQTRFFSKQRQVLEGDALDEEVFRNSLELSSRTLAEYVLYRDYVIKRLAETNEDAKEAVVHNLIVPQHTRFEGDRLVDGIYSNNAWILDDRFMTFRTILSEAKMREVIDAITLESDKIDDDGRPDISLIFSADPDDAAKVDVAVVEVKRRAADEKEGMYASTQLINRARKLIKHCPKIQRMWYFGIIEIDDEIHELLTTYKWIPIYSKGKVYYQEFTVERVPVPVYLLSWKAIVEDASARNHAFLEILKADIREQINKGEESSQSSQFVTGCADQTTSEGAASSASSVLVESGWPVH